MNDGMFQTVQCIEPRLDGSGLKIGIVMSRFNQRVCDGLRDACLSALAEYGVAMADDVVLTTVPGALEIPLILQSMAKSGKFDALIALGAVIRGETYHFEIVANESGAGIARVGLDFSIPVANAVLTAHTEEQAQARVREKGCAAAAVAIEMARLQQSLADY